MKVPSEYTDPFREYHLLGRIGARIDDGWEAIPSREGLYLVDMPPVPPDVLPFACIDAVYRDPDTEHLFYDGDPVEESGCRFLYLALPDW